MKSKVLTVLIFTAGWLSMAAVGHALDLHDRQAAYVLSIAGIGFIFIFCLRNRRPYSSVKFLS